MLLDLLPHARAAATRPAAGGREIWCLVRKAWLVATPEEFVRQGLIAFLQQRGYPPTLMQVERSVGRSRDRLDLLALDREGAPFLLAETKAPGFALEPAVRQLARYNRHWRASYALATNGREALCYRLDFSRELLRPATSVPPYPA